MRKIEFSAVTLSQDEAMSTSTNFRFSKEEKHCKCKTKVKDAASGVIQGREIIEMECLLPIWIKKRNK